ncbi:MAG TPA: CapA family protein, partial [Chitinophagales bacterium]|nr:CapA family protein [Chitinophagales bacterium]
MTDGRQKIEDGRQQPLNMRIYHCVLIALLLLMGMQPAEAQDKPKENSFITFRQRLLNQKRDESSVEKVDSFSKLHLMICGNVYQTEKHAAYAYDKTTGKYDYRSQFKYIQPLLNLGDITLVNLKTFFSNDVKNMFSSPDEFGLALKYAGVNAVLSANVHTANIDKAVLKRTQEVLDEYDIYHTGAFLDNIQRLGNYPMIMNKKGFKIAVLNYTNLTSRPSLSRDFVINEIDKALIDRDMRLLRAYKADFTIVYFDWGANKQDMPSYAQQELAQYVFQAGANLVVGTHPNAPMRLETMNYSYNNTQQEGIIAYSLGNLLSSNEDLNNRNGYIIDMEIKKNNFTTETHVSDWGVVPVYTYYDTTTVRGKTNVYSVPCANIESGDIFPNIPYIEKRRAVNSAYQVRKMLGNIADEIQYNLNELIVNNVEESINITNAPLNNKHNPKREDDVKPSEAPALPVTVDGSANTPSLALLYGEQPEPAKPAATTAAAKAAEKKAERENSYLAQKKKAQEAFDAPVVVSSAPTPAAERPKEEAVKT